MLTLQSRIEKKRLTKDAYFRLATTHIGISIADSYKLADFHQIIDFTMKGVEKKMTHCYIRQSAGTSTNNKYCKTSRRIIMIPFTNTTAL
jgi:hypothetical protein